MKKLFMFSAVFLCFCASVFFAASDGTGELALAPAAKAATIVDSGMCGDNVTYTLDSDGLLTISGTGAMSDYSWGGYIPWKDSSVKSVVISDGVTSICDRAFDGCEGLTSVTIPDSVTSIGWSAFYNCTGLTNITIPDSVISIGDSAFAKCTGLTSITIGNAVTGIGRSAFKDCTGLTSIMIPDSVTSIGDGAFYGCTGLTSITIPDGVTSIGKYAFYGCSSLTSITIPDSVTSIGDSAFSGCEKLTGITIPVSVTDIGSYAFYKTNLKNVYYEGDLNAWLKINKTDNPCEGANLYFNGQLLKNVTIPYGVTNIGNAFAGCKSIESVVLSNSVTSIGDSAFRGCTGLTSVTIPNSVTSIGEDAFYECSSLTNITIPDSVTSIGDSAFRGCTGLTSITIPDSVTSIGEVAFSGCTGLTSITIPKSVTSIGVWAFYDCKNLTKVFYEADLESWLKIEGSNSIYIPIWSPCYNGSDVTELYFNGQLVTEVNIPEGVESIKAGAFAGCSSIKKLSLPKSVKDIGNGAFQDCRNLEIINMPYGLKTIGHYAFSGCESLKSLILPDSVSYVGEASFSGCSSLEKLIISEKMEQISMYCFSDCVSLTEVVLPIGISHVIQQAFDNCTSLKNMYILNSDFDIYLTDYTIPKTVTLHSHPGGMVEKNAKEEGYNFVPLHMWDNGTVTREPQVGVAGERTFTCTVCSATRTEEIAPLVPSAPDRIEVKSSDSAKELTGGIVGATHSVTVSELLASSNASYIVDKDGNRITETTKPLATGMKIILESGGERLEKVISVLGDVNGDGEVSVSDARGALRAAVGLDTLEGAYLNAARVNGSNEVAVSDARSILRAAVALDTGKDWLANIK